MHSPPSDFWAARVQYMYSTIANQRGPKPEHQKVYQGPDSQKTATMRHLFKVWYWAATRIQSNFVAEVAFVPAKLWNGK